MLGLYIAGSIIFGAIGYLIGSVMWAVILAKLFYHTDIRKQGSGNAGATNVTRSYGLKLGAPVFFLDMAKPVLAVVIAYLLQTYSGVSIFSKALVQLAGVAAILGHIFPLFFKFKGGKGVASGAGFFLVVAWPLFFVFVILFFSILKFTKKVSLSSMLASSITLPTQIAFAFIPYLNSEYVNPLMQYPVWWVNTLAIVVIIILVIIKHAKNIRRLINKTEHEIAAKSRK